MGMALRTALIALSLLAVLPAAARAEFGIAPGSFTMSLTDGAGNPETRAGAHPARLKTTFSFNTVNGLREAAVKDIVVELPPGMIGDPSAVPTCSREQFGVVLGEASCPPESQVGLAFVEGFDEDPIYNLEPRPDSLAEFGSRSIIGQQRFNVRMRPDGRGFALETRDSIQDLAVTGGSVELWGVPADHQVGTATARRPLLTAPTGCDGGPLLATMRVNTWEEPAVWHSATTVAGPAPVGCEELSMDPQFDVALDAATTDTPTGADVSFTLPQNDDPDGQANARVRDVALVLPEGMAISPSAANGRTACSDAQLELGTNDQPGCPPSSRVGAVEVESALVGEPIPGTVYLGEQLPGDRYRLFVAVDGRGLHLRFKGSLVADPKTGRLTASLRDLLEAPFSRIRLRFDGGPRAALVTPLTCGTRAAVATIQPHGGGPPVTSSASIAIGADPSGRSCPAVVPFAPTFTAGTSPARAGGAASFSMTLRRRDGEQLLGRLSVSMPQGLSARLASVQRCPSASVGARTCPLDSRVGSAVAEVGAGPNPFAFEGDAYLTGPYKRAPFGLALVFRAVAGPFDLGTIVVRGAMRLDPNDGHVTVETDALPSVVEGIPLRLQTLGLDIDRPGFMINPTSCAPTRIAATIRSVDEAVSSPAARFAVGGCRALRFRPKLKVTLTDRSELHKGGRPGLRLRIRSATRSANIREAQVRLPKLLELDPGRVTALCSREQARDRECPKGSRVGRARGRTPLLSGQLAGPVHVVQPIGNGLPDLWASVEGADIRLNLKLETSVKRGRVTSKFADIPDVPLSQFTLQFASGERGIISLKRSLCAGRRARRLVARAALRAYNDAHRLLMTPVHARPDCRRRGSSRSAGADTRAQTR